MLVVSSTLSVIPIPPLVTVLSNARLLLQLLLVFSLPPAALTLSEPVIECRNVEVSLTQPKSVYASVSRLLSF